ncbi:P-loop ATPase, Sll1717 family [Burkholderia orbicola]|uniref:P-loop ATPase, Sll1717 family n=1 Tax=Burkholderia orbicola TaxID=2978683 RepID=UPI002FE1222B
MTTHDVLVNSGFGSRIAEDELDNLHAYFVETDQWKRLLSGEVDVVFGAKGAGKSALYSLLVAKKDELRLGRRTLFLAAENPRGTPAFRDLIAEPPLSEEQFRALWKLYFLSLAADYLRHHMTISKTKDPSALSVIHVLTENGLLPPGVTLITRLKTVLGYLRKYIPNIEGAVTEPNTGLVFKGKITLSEPSSEQRNEGYQSLDDLLALLNHGFRNFNITVWLVLDRLDVAFAESDALEGNALRALFRTYLDILGLSHIKIKIFLRDDVWRRIVSGGFREASHVTRSLTLTWSQQSLLNLIVRRLLVNDSVCTHYGVDRIRVLADADLQSEIFYKIFPGQIDAGQNRPNTLDWMLSRTADGTKRTAPRELIHLLQAAREEQLKLTELGNSPPEDNLLLGKAAVRAALPAVSKARYEQTLCAEYPALQSYLRKMEREKAQQSLASLSGLWGCSEDKALEIAERLVEAGFFERRGSKQTPVYWVPMLYRAALDLVQGAA